MIIFLLKTLQWVHIIFFMINLKLSDMNNEIFFLYGLFNAFSASMLAIYLQIIFMHQKKELSSSRVWILTCDDNMKECRKVILNGGRPFIRGPDIMA